MSVLTISVKPNSTPRGAKDLLLPIQLLMAENLATPSLNIETTTVGLALGVIAKVGLALGVMAMVGLALVAIHMVVLAQEDSVVVVSALAGTKIMVLGARHTSLPMVVTMASIVLVILVLARGQTRREDRVFPT